MTLSPWVGSGEGGRPSTTVSFEGAMCTRGLDFSLTHPERRVTSTQTRPLEVKSETRPSTIWMPLPSVP